MVTIYSGTGDDGPGYYRVLVEFPNFQSVVPHTPLIKTLFIDNHLFKLLTLPRRLCFPLSVCWLVSCFFFVREITQKQLNGFQVRVREEPLQCWCVSGNILSLYLTLQDRVFVYCLTRK